MSRATPRVQAPISRVLAFAVVGGLVAVTLGMVAVTLAPDNGFADLAAASVTRVFLVPLGVLVGGGMGWYTGR